jgi:hypothetical protein
LDIRNINGNRIFTSEDNGVVVLLEVNEIEIKHLLNHKVIGVSLIKLEHDVE